MLGDRMDDDDPKKPAAKNERSDDPKSFLDVVQSSPLAGADINLDRADDTIPVDGPRHKRQLGVDRGKVQIADDFDAPNEDISKLFEDP